MKKIFVFMASAALMLAASCNKMEENTTTEPAVETELITIELNPMTKTQLSGTETLWSAGDAVDVLVDGESVGTLTLVKESTFSGELTTVGLTGPATLHYPAGVKEVPATQTAVENSFANGAALLEGETTIDALRAGNGASLQNTTALLQFTSPLKGDVTFTIGSTTYTIQGCEAGKTYYACVDPANSGKLSYTVGIVLGDKEKLDFAPEANKVYPLGTLALKESSYSVIGDYNEWSDDYMYETNIHDNFFVLYGVSFESKGGFKIRKPGTNGAWVNDYNFGSVNENVKTKNSIVGLYVDGGSKNLTVEPGKYDIYFDRAAGRAYVMESGKPYTDADEPTTTPIYSLIGSFEGSGWNDIDMTYSGDGVWTIVRTFKKDDQWKIRKHGDWGENWGYDNVHMGQNYTTKAVDGNVIMNSAGTYVICFVREWNTIRIVTK